MSARPRPRGRRRGATLARAAALLLALAAPAAAADVPEALGPGRPHRVTLEPAATTAVAFDAVGGTALTLVVRGRGTAEPRVTVLDPDGAALVVDAPEGRVARRLPLSVTGRHTILLEDVVGAGGEAALRFALTLPRRVALPLDGGALTVGVLSPGELGAVSAVVRVPEGVSVDLASVGVPGGEALEPADVTRVLRGGRLLRVGPFTTEEPGIVTLAFEVGAGGPPPPATFSDLVVLPRTRFSRRFKLR